MPKPAMPSKSSIRPFVLVVAALAALAVVGLSACDATSAPAAAPGGATAPRQVTVVGEGQVEGTPDTLTANVAIESIAADATAALNQSSSRQQAVIDALVGFGVDRTDISTTQVSLQPQFGENTTITGYVASNAIDVKIRQIDSASQALALIQTTGGNDTRINSVNYSIEDDSQLVLDARARAFNDARDRAEQYAELSGLELGSVLSISETGGGAAPPPIPFERNEVAASVPLEPGQQTVDFSVTAIWELG